MESTERQYRRQLQLCSGCLHGGECRCYTEASSSQISNPILSQQNANQHYPNPFKSQPSSQSRFNSLRLPGARPLLSLCAPLPPLLFPTRHCRGPESRIPLGYDVAHATHVSLEPSYWMLRQVRVCERRARVVRWNASERRWLLECNT